MSQLINRHLLKKFIKWPSGDQVQDVFHGFERTRHFPKVIGALDGTHIPIKTPKKDGEVYINRKKFHSINVAAVCDHQMMFTFVCVGWPGSTHDSRVFKNTKLGIACENIEKRKDFFPEKCHILADSAYELNEFVMTPFKDNGALTKLEKDYNFYHSSTRMKIENAFAYLKGRFRRLKYIDMHDPQRLVEFITSCFVMHNICLLNSDTVEEYLNDGEIEEPPAQEIEADRDADVTAVAKRRAISGLLSVFN
ncbi:hypothetical protein SNE40_016003 [Patella caerulea]